MDQSSGKAQVVVIKGDGVHHLVEQLVRYHRCKAVGKQQKHPDGERTHCRNHLALGQSRNKDADGTQRRSQQQQSQKVSCEYRHIRHPKGTHHQKIDQSDRHPQEIHRQAGKKFPQHHAGKTHRRRKQKLLGPLLSFFAEQLHRQKRHQKDGNGKQVGKDIAQVGRIADQRGGKKVVTGNSKKHRQKHITDRRGQIGVHLPFINGCHRFSPPLLLIHFRSAAVPAHLQEHPVPSAA